MSDKLLSTSEAANDLGVSSIRVRAMIRDGKLKAQKIGRDYIIKESDLTPVKNRKPGRPAKNSINK
jgi:excisionase family DNA binding protein